MERNLEWAPLETRGITGGILFMWGLQGFGAVEHGSGFLLHFSSLASITERREMWEELVSVRALVLRR